MKPWHKSTIHQIYKYQRPALTIAVSLPDMENKSCKERKLTARFLPDKEFKTRKEEKGVNTTDDNISRI